MYSPYSDPVAMVTRHIDLHDKPTNDRDRALDTLSRLFLSWIPQGLDPKFVLKHPDFGIQNFLVNENGNLIGAIDWDGVCFQPRFVGNESYPIWLTHDWNPEKDIEDDRLSTPEDLTRYRSMYAEFIGESKARIEGSSSTSMTKLTLLAGVLALAVSTPSYNGIMGILVKILRELSAVIPNDPRKFCSEYEEIGREMGEENDTEANDRQLVTEIGKAIDEGTLDEDRMGWLRDGFAALCDSLSG